MNMIWFNHIENLRFTFYKSNSWINITSLHLITHLFMDTNINPEKLEQPLTVSSIVCVLCMEVFRFVSEKNYQPRFQQRGCVEVIPNRMSVYNVLSVSVEEHVYKWNLCFDITIVVINRCQITNYFFC